MDLYKINQNLYQNHNHYDHEIFHNNDMGLEYMMLYTNFLNKIFLVTYYLIYISDNI